MDHCLLNGQLLAYDVDGVCHQILKQGPSVPFEVEDRFLVFSLEGCLQAATVRINHTDFPN